MRILLIFACLISLVYGIIVPTDPRVPYMFPPGYGTHQMDMRDALSSAQRGLNYPHILDRILQQQQQAAAASQGLSYGPVQYAIDLNGIGPKLMTPNYLIKKQFTY